MRYGRSIAIGSYFAASLVWVYWVLDRQLFFGSDARAIAALTVVALVHLALGFGVGRVWALALPFLPTALAIPLGYPSANLGEPPPIWLGQLLWTPLAVALIAIGIGARKLVRRTATNS